MEGIADIFGRRGISLHFIWLEDYESVAQRGVLCHFLRSRSGIPDQRAYKAQRQIGSDLVSIWDPWSFLHRHWRNRPLGSENQPWVIFNINLLDHFEDAEELRMADSLRDPRESAWMGDTVCADRAHRKRFDRVRRRLSEMVRIDAPAPDLDHVKVVQSLLELVAALASRKDDDPQELCLVLEPSLRKYDFPGYKTFENFVRGRIHPKSIIGVVGPAALTASQRVRRVAEISGHALYQVEST